MTLSELPAAPLTLTLLGPMQVLVRGEPLPHLRSRKSLWLLALMVLRYGKPIERGWLAGILWPDNDQSQAFANLRSALSELRKALGCEAARLQSPSRDTLLLELTEADVDVIAFDSAIKSGEPPLLKQAVVLYQGALLEGCLEEWVPQERAVREQSCLQALLILAEAALAAGDFPVAIGYYRQAVSLDPWREAAQRGLMEAFSQDGDSNAALQVYRKFVELLRSDPKAVPDEETSALYARLRSKARLRAAVPIGAPIAAAKVSAAQAVAGYLPHPLTELIGREDERFEVGAKLRRSRLVTLTGPGGIGKTRLALEVAAGAVEDYPDGVWMVSLEAVTEGHVDRQIASVLGVKEPQGQSLLEHLGEYLRAKRLLLVLDNCEHLLEASAHAAGYLLRECAEVRVLATSRAALGITGEMAWPVPALAVPDPLHLPASPATRVRVLMGYESVQLFVERAQAVQKTFALTGDNARAMAQICFRLEGVPLAIELAAARVKAMTVEQIAARLDNHLSLLTSGNRAALPRQQTLRATLDWSYNLLSGAERILLSRLSVFAGGWCLEAAEDVGSGAAIETFQVMDLLVLLVDKSLVIFEERNEEIGGRYRLLETVRQYAAERLEISGEKEGVRTRHRDYYLTLAEEAEPLLTGPDQGTQMARLMTEHENLRAALAWWGGEKNEAEMGLRLAGALWRFWEVRGYYSEGRAYLSEALRRPGAGRRSNGRAKALNAAGVLASYQGDIGAIRALHEEGLEIYRELGNREGEAWSLYDLGNVAVGQGDHGAARTLYEQSLAIFRERGNKRGIGASLHQLGSQVSKQGDSEAARALYEESLAIFRELKNRQGIAWTLNNLGSLVREQGDLEVARKLYEESGTVYRELGHKRGVGWSLHQLGRLVHEQGDPAAARKLYEESLTISRELADKQGTAWSLNDLGDVVREQGDYGMALTLYQESLAISRELGDRQGAAWSLRHLGNLAREQGNYSTSQRLYQESLAIFREMANKQATAWLLSDWGNLAHDQGDFRVAQTLYQESLAIFRELVDKKGMVVVLGGLAVTLSPDQPEKAVCLWGSAQSQRKSIGVPLLPPEQTRHDRQMAQARAVLGEEGFAAAWSKGRSLTWEQSAEYAMEETEAEIPLGLVDFRPPSVL